MDSWVPTHSSTASAPMFFVSSFTLATPSSPRSATMSVAPYSSASSWRFLCRLMAMMRSAPICLAASTPIRPTAPSPTTTTVDPGCTRAASAAYQPVPSTSEVASRLGIRSSDGISARRDQRAVGERHARKRRLRAAHELALLAGRLEAKAAMRTGVVGDAEGAHDELAGLDGLDRAADLDHHAAIFVAHVHRLADRSARDTARGRSRKCRSPTA